MKSLVTDYVTQKLVYWFQTDGLLVGTFLPSLVAYVPMFDVYKSHLRIFAAKQEELWAGTFAIDFVPMVVHSVLTDCLLVEAFQLFQGFSFGLIPIVRY